MEKVSSGIEALAVCREYNLKVEFTKDRNFDREFVIIQLNAWTTVAGKTIIEAINRLCDMYHTAPINYEKLEWYEESQKYLNGIR